MLRKQVVLSKKVSLSYILRYGLVVRITRFHRVGRGSIPRVGNIRQVSRVVKGGRLKIYCVSFMGSNPILVIYFFFSNTKKSELELISKI